MRTPALWALLPAFAFGCGRVESEGADAGADADADSDTDSGWDACFLDTGTVDCSNNTGASTCLATVTCVGASASEAEARACLAAATPENCVVARDLGACACGSCPSGCRTDPFDPACSDCLCAECYDLTGACMGMCGE